MRPAEFDFVRAANVAEALGYLQYGSPIAGGQSLLRDMRQRQLSPRRLVDISHIDELDYINMDGDVLVVGATTKLAAIAASPLVKDKCDALHQAAGFIGDVQIRNRGTAAGNICGTWSPAGWSVDIGVVLAASKGEVVVRSVSGERRIDGAEFVAAEKSPIEVSELITELRFGAADKSAYVRLSRRTADASIGSAAAFVTRKSGRLELGLALGQVHRRIVRATAVEAAVASHGIDDLATDLALAELARTVSPPDTAHANSEYRRSILPVIAKRAIRAAL
ncbi:hypothetical protein GWG65_31210 [Bradyrhizobium sp. CSA207]|uniref:FAD binding domain-containing protein n=1 Tax=Bradyrhizobium sp. CSA207 TaxID=2698826 RepID=UPI0023B123FB|nr:FAD binding domain-containing protein [Bradyrhizobium sp. CSA207]MDE5445797.1 hypothetical protein [Bradyrhizobium sp. CSA207]